MNIQKIVLIWVLFLGSMWIYGIKSKAEAAPARIQITQGTIQADPIAVHEFIESDSQTSIIGTDIASVIANDLKNSGLFAPMDEAMFPQTIAALLKEGISFEKWQQIRARFLVHGKIIRNSGDIRLEFRLYDIFEKKQLLAQAIEGNPQKWRRLAHAVADLIYTRVTNEAGFFNTQIVYSEPHGQGRKSTTQLMIMDYDGYNPKPLTSAKHLVLTPRYAPNGREIAYLKIHHNKAEVFTMNIQTKKTKKLGDFEGMSFAPRYSPDGENIVMSLSQNGRSAIYTMNIKQHHLKRLTDHLSIDTSPCYSPDGSKIVFTSDRSGQEHLHIMNADGSDVRRISYGAAQYSQPVWSPRGDLIAFTKRQGAHFYIGVMSPEGVGERMIADGWLVEDSCWSGNGRYLIFTKQLSIKHKTKLFMVDLTGYNQRWINTPSAASNGTWSPLVAAP